MNKLIDYRQHLRNKVRRATPAEKETLRAEKQGVTERITAKGISDLVPMQDLFNEWHVKTRARKCGMSCAIRECRARRLQPSRHLDTKKSRQSKRMAR